MKIAPMNMPQTTPKEMRWLEKRAEFAMGWADGHQSVFPLLYLRKECPCALCRGEREDHNPFRVIKELPEALKAMTIDPVGNYAIQIRWSDGHATGIYTFDFLRRLCPCSHCK